MKRTILILLISLLSTIAHASTKYISIEYNGSDIELKKKNWVQKMLTDENKQVVLILTIIDSEDLQNSTILITPKKLDSYFRTDDEVRSSFKSNIPVLTFKPVKSFRTISMKVDFLAIDKNNLNSFSNGLKTLASLYSSSQPQTAALTQTLIESFFSMVKDNRSAFIENTIGLKNASLKDGEPRLYTLYFDSNGDIVKDLNARRPSSSATLNFTVTYNNKYPFDWESGWYGQPGLSEKDHELFEILKASDGNTQKNENCNKLKQQLLVAHDHDTAEKLTAIAVNTIAWRQDDTVHGCIPLTEAKNYRVKYKLSKILGCETDQCLATKKALNALRNNNSYRANKALNVKLSSVSKCKANYNELMKWENFQYDEENKSYNVKTTLKTSGGGQQKYVQSFDWEDGKLSNHSCKAL